MEFLLFAGITPTPNLGPFAFSPKRGATPGVGGCVACDVRKQPAIKQSR
jgi:hypothetical protein